MPKGTTSVRDELERLHEQIGAKRDIEADRFSESDFYYARKFKWGEGLRRWGHFADFNRFLRQLVDSQKCGPSCHPPVSEVAALDLCPPEPQIPSLPKPKPQKPFKPDLSKGLVHFLPPLSFSPPSPVPPPPMPEPAPESSPPPVVDLFPSAVLEKHARLQHKISQEKAPDKLFLGLKMGISSCDHDSRGPDDVRQIQMKVHFDGSSLVVEVFGVRTDPILGPPDVKAWPSFWLPVFNVSFPRNSRRERADEAGRVQAKVGAKEGDVFVFWGEDSLDRHRSVNFLAYQITPEGKVRWLGNFLWKDAPPNFEDVVVSLRNLASKT